MWIGVAITSAVAVTTLLFFFAPDISRALQPSIELVALMENAGALRKDSPVWIAGREVGSVRSIGFRAVHSDSAERIVVHLRIPRKYAGQIRQDSRARLTAGRLISEPVLDIAPGSPGADPVQNLDTLRVSPSGTLLGLLDRTDSLSSAFHQLYLDLLGPGRRVERRRRDLTTLNRQLSASGAGLRQLAADLSASPLRTLSDSAFRQRVEHLSTQARELSSALHASALRAADAHRRAQPALHSLAARADTISSIVDAMRSRIEASGGGLLIRAQRDSAIVRALQEARVQLDSLIAETRRNPLRFWF